MKYHVNSNLNHNGTTLEKDSVVDGSLFDEATLNVLLEDNTLSEFDRVRADEVVDEAAEQQPPEDTPDPETPVEVVTENPTETPTEEATVNETPLEDGSQESGKVVPLSEEELPDPLKPQPSEEEIAKTIEDLEGGSKDTSSEEVQLS